MLTAPPQITTQDTLDETLDRISKKAGVKAALVLDRATGSLLKTSGQVSSLRPAKTAQSPSAASFPTEQGDGEGKGVEEYARLIWGWVNASGGLAGDLDAEVGGFSRAGPRGIRLTVAAGRGEATTAADEEAGACYRAGPEIPTRCGA